MSGSGLKRPLVKLICAEVDTLYERDVQALREFKRIVFETELPIQELPYCFNCMVPYKLLKECVFCASSYCKKTLFCGRPFCNDKSSIGVACQGEKCERRICDELCARRCQICNIMICSWCISGCHQCNRIFCNNHIGIHNLCEECCKLK